MCQQVTAQNKDRTVVYHSLKINSSQALAAATSATVVLHRAILADSPGSEEASMSQRGFQLCTYGPEVGQ